MLTYIFIMPRALLTFAHVRNYARVNRMEVPKWKNRMEMVEMVDCNGWPFWASIAMPGWCRSQLKMSSRVNLSVWNLAVSWRKSTTSNGQCPLSQVYEKTRIGLFCKHTFLPIVVQFARLFDRGIECSTVS